MVLAVLPFRPFVEDGAEHRAPREALGLDPNGYVPGANQIWTKVLAPSGLSSAPGEGAVHKRGRQKHGAYILDDAVFVLSKAKE